MIKKIFSFFQPYDPKRSCWVTIKDEGFVEGVIENTEGDKVTVKVRKSQKQFVVFSFLSEPNEFFL